MFLADYGAMPQVWGEVDCSLVLADWAMANGYTDCAGHLRGTYDTAEECMAVVEAAGGLVPLVGGLAVGLGLQETPRAVPGAIGVIGSPTNIHRQWGAIFDGRDWQVRLQSGFVAVKASVIIMWII